MNRIRLHLFDVSLEAFVCVNSTSFHDFDIVSHVISFVPVEIHLLWLRYSGIEGILPGVEPETAGKGGRRSGAKGGDRSCVPDRSESRGGLPQLEFQHHRRLK